MKKVTSLHILLCLAIVATVAMGFLRGVLIGREQGGVTNISLDSIRNEVKQLKIQRESDERISRSIRTEINILKFQRSADSLRIALYDNQIKNIKQKYEKIGSRYNDIGADSISVLFGRAFDY